MQKVLLAVIAAAIVAIGLTSNFVGAHHEPADKTAGTANTIDQVDESKVLLEETMRVSSTSDLILATSAECSILTSLNTSGGPNESTETDGSFGQVELWITIDGKRVPVSSNPQGDGDDGRVVFCNRAYQRTVTDNEQDENGDGGMTAVKDGLDSEDDFIRTRAANAFNWMAFNVGKSYDAGNDNIVTIQLHGDYTKESTDGTPDCAQPPRPDNELVPYTDTCADAFVGRRSLIVEAVHASTHEQTAGTGIGG